MVAVVVLVKVGIPQRLSEVEEAVDSEQTVGACSSAAEIKLHPSMAQGEVGSAVGKGGVTEEEEG